MTQQNEQLKQDGGELIIQETVAGAPQRHTVEFMTYPTEGINGVVFDMDDCLYQNQEWRKANLNGEATAIATALGWPEANDVDAAKARMKTERQRVGEELGLGRMARNTETVIHLMNQHRGMDEANAREWYDTTRIAIARNLDPKAYIQNDPRVVNMLQSVVDSGRQVAIASNSPSAVVEMITEALGIEPELRQRLNLIGPDVVGTSKPNPEYYKRVAEQMGLSPEECMMVGDDLVNDGFPSMEAGMGAIIIESVDDVVLAVEEALHEESYAEISLGTIAEGAMPVPGEVKIVGVTGSAGAGKSTSAAELVNEYRGRGVDAHLLSLDTFFILSSKQRTAWLKGEDLADDMEPTDRANELRRREDQDLWWDFEKAAYWLQQLKSGASIAIENTYNRAEGGELTGRVEINLSHEQTGSVIVFEGVGVPRVVDNMDHLLFVNAHRSVREQRLLKRDISRRLEILLDKAGVAKDSDEDTLAPFRVQAEAAALERWGITERYERKLFGEARHSINGKAIVIDNSRFDDDTTTLDKLRRLPARIPTH